MSSTATAPFLYPIRLTPLFLAAGLLVGSAVAQGEEAAAPRAPASGASAATALEPSLVLRPLPGGDAAAALPIVLQAASLSSQPDLQTVAEGHVEFRRGGLVIRAEHMAYDRAQDLASASGQVRVNREGFAYSGPELQLHVQRFEGFFLQPDFEFRQIGAGGHADRIDFINSARSRATKAEYTSCPRDGPAEPAWLLRTDSVLLDFDTDEGVAEGAVLRFLGVPILALPTLSFPLSDARKSGWLPPSFSTDSRSGIELSMPYFWNIAPNRDATLTPRAITKRGLGLNSEFRYLESDMEGVAQHDWLPYDRLAGRSREALHWVHQGRLAADFRFSADVVRVSDDDWWKDFPSASRSLTPRLLPLRIALERPFSLAGGEGLIYAREQRWQVLQAPDSPVVSPYDRSPQVGARLGAQAGGWQVAVEGEYNRFTLPTGAAAQAGRAEGQRWHALGSLSHPWREPGWWLVPRLSVNAATYDESALSPGTGARAGRAIPTASMDLGFEFERPTQVFGRSLQQTLEPRLLYVRTPYVAQSQLPNYDSAAKDFNFDSIYSDNQFTGVDRVSDASQLTAGVTTRFVDSASGAEALRLGLVQRYLFRTQRVTALTDGTPDGPPLTQRFSDLLLLGSTSLIAHWTFDSSVQYSTESQRVVRSVVGGRFSPGPLRTVSATYRLARGLSEQLEIGWQWPVFGTSTAAESGAQPWRRAAIGTHACSGTWYTVGRVNYSLPDTRITDSVLGFEYDAGCWIGRIVAERLSTGSSQATTRFMFQLELVGLSRLGSNPLQVLKDNIPGYRLLREERGSASSSDDRPSAPFYD